MIKKIIDHVMLPRDYGLVGGCGALWKGGRFVPILQSLECEYHSFHIRPRKEMFVSCNETVRKKIG